MPGLKARQKPNHPGFYVYVRRWRRTQRRESYGNPGKNASGRGGARSDGKLTIGEGDELLKERISNLVQQGHRNLLLNLEGVPYVDSAGLGEIVRTYTTVSRQGGQLKLVNLTKRITDLLSITKLLTVFETYESEDEAVKSFSG